MAVNSQICRSVELLFNNWFVLEWGLPVCFSVQPSGAVVTESQTFKKRSDFQSNDDYAVYVRENIQVNPALSKKAIVFSDLPQNVSVTFSSRVLDFLICRINRMLESESRKMQKKTIWWTVLAFSV